MRASLVATSLSARLAVGMLGLPMILTVRDATGSYAAARLVSGAWSLSVAVSSPLRGRLVDRRGSRSALPPLALVSAGALAALPLVGETGLVWALAPVAALSGLAIPPFVASMRDARGHGRADARRRPRVRVAGGGGTRGDTSVVGEPLYRDES